MIRRLIRWLYRRSRNAAPLKSVPGETLLERMAYAGGWISNSPKTGMDP